MFGSARARVGRIWGAPAVALLVLAGGACKSDDQAAAQEQSTSTSFDARIDDEDGDDDRWSSGTATLVVDGAEWTFDLDFCATQSFDPDSDGNTATLSVNGASSQGDPVELRVVETVSNELSARIQVVSVHFEDDDGNRLRAWEAQRVVDMETGEVDDMHGDGTTPLLQVEDDDDLVVTVSDADFWQFDMTGDDDVQAGTGRLEARCTGE